MIAAYIEIEKIRYRAVEKSVDEVTNSAADDNSDPYGLTQVFRAPKPDDEESDDSNGKNGQRCWPPGPQVG